MKKVEKVVLLNEMPFDKFDVDSNQFVHATGREIYYDDRTTEVEYEDHIIDCGDAPIEYEEDDYEAEEQEHSITVSFDEELFNFDTLEAAKEQIKEWKEIDEENGDEITYYIYGKNNECIDIM